MASTSTLTVVVDTREQAAWQFPPGIATVRRGLKAGDYSIVGLEDRVAIERKSLGDLVNTVIGNWIRFRKELNRLSAFDLACVVVEANIQDVIDHRYESEANPDSVLGRVNAIFVDHGIPVYFWGNRPAAIHMATRMLYMAWKRWGGEVGEVGEVIDNGSAKAV